MSKSEYGKLKKVWYKRLATEKSEEYPNGFKDIETASGLLKGGTSNWKFNNPRHTRFSQTAKADYYYLAYQFLNKYSFESELHRVIWEYHVEGLGCERIETILKEAGIKRQYKNKKSRAMSDTKILQIINYYKKIMKNGF